MTKVSALTMAETTSLPGTCHGAWRAAAPNAFFAPKFPSPLNYSWLSGYISPAPPSCDKQFAACIRRVWWTTSDCYNFNACLL